MVSLVKLCQAFALAQAFKTEGDSYEVAITTIWMNFKCIIQTISLEVCIKEVNINARFNDIFSTLNSEFKINFNSLDLAAILGLGEIHLSPSGSKKFTDCVLVGCDFSIFDLSYDLNFGTEWVRGSSTCSKALCDYYSLDHAIETSNTADIFAILNRAGILNPLSSLYIYTAISSGQKINTGHL